VTAALEGKVALVTGAAKGLGRAIAVAMAEAGADVVVFDLDRQGLVATEAQIRDAGRRVLALEGDVTSAERVADAVAQCRGAFGKLDVLVNCAATFLPDGTVVDIDEAAWRRTLDVGVNGAFLMSKYAIAEMLRGKGGAIVNIASVLGHVGKKGRSWYCAQKGALVAMSKAMALDHAKQNIRVNSLSPGPVATDQLIAKYGGRERAEAARGIDTAFERLGEAGEVAAAAVFLASDFASFITGADLIVDGGLTAQ